MKKFCKAGFILTLITFSMFLLTACDRGDIERIPVVHDFDFSDVQLYLDVGWTGLPLDFEAELTIGLWSAVNTTAFYRDIGRNFIDPAEIREVRAAGAIAAAQAFNYFFPNVAINVNIEASGSNRFQNRVNFHTMHGIHEDIFVTAELPEEIMRGNIADLSIFADDPVFDIINPRFTAIGTLHDRLWATPFLASPHGVFVNRSLAENQNLDPPPINWNLREFEQFVSHSRTDEFAGIDSTPFEIMNTINQDFHYSLAFRSSDDVFVRMDTQAMRDSHRGIQGMERHALAPGVGRGQFTSAWVGGRNNWRMFAEGNLLTFHPSPHMISNAASPTHENRVQAQDWDYFPRPSSDWVGNHVGTNIMLLCIRNFAGDTDGVLTQESYDRLRLSWEFLRFFTMDIRSWTAKANFTFGPDNHNALDFSLPFVTGQLYWDMLDLHLQAYQRRALANSTRFPAYHFVLQLWEQGQHWGFGGNAFPMMAGGRAITHEWNTRGTAASVGANVADPNWLDQLFVHLPVWDVDFNERWDARFGELYDAIMRWHPTIPDRF